MEKESTWCFEFVGANWGWDQLIAPPRIKKPLNGDGNIGASTSPRPTT